MIHVFLILIGCVYVSVLVQNIRTFLRLMSQSSPFTILHFKSWSSLGAYEQYCFHVKLNWKRNSRSTSNMHQLMGVQCQTGIIMKYSPEIYRVWVSGAHYQLLLHFINPFLLSLYFLLR